jgi:hypothetical protein
MKILIQFAALLLSSLPVFAGGPIAIVAHTAAIATATAAVNMTGANAIVIFTTNNFGVSDSCSNSYTLLAYYPQPGYTGESTYVSYNPTICSTSMTFTPASGQALTVVGLSNVSSLDQINNATVTPTNNNEAVLAGDIQQFGSPGPSIGSPFTQLDSVYTPGGSGPGAASAYWIQTTKATATPAWTNPGYGQSAVVSFYSTETPGTLTVSGTLPEAVVGTAYSYCFTANAGIQPYTWSQTAGTLPSGFSFSTSTGCVTASSPPSAGVTSGLVFKVTDSTSPTPQTASTSSQTLYVAATALSLTAGPCTSNCNPSYGGTPGLYINCTQNASCAPGYVIASGGITPYTYSWLGANRPDPGVNSQGHANPSLPAGMVVNPSTGVITGTPTGQGEYCYIQFLVTDAAGAGTQYQSCLYVNGNNTFGGNSLLPANSLFNYPYGTLTTTAPSYFQIQSPFTSDYLRNFEGGQNGGFPINTVPYNQPNESFTSATYTQTFTSGPVSCNAEIENTYNALNVTDGHSITIQLPGGGNPLHEWDTYQAFNIPYAATNCTFNGGTVGQDIVSNYDLIPSTYALTNGLGSTDAAGLPLGPLIPNVDEIIGTGTVTSPNGSITQLTRLIVPPYSYNHSVHVPPATSSYGTGYCTPGTGFTDPTINGLITETPGQGNSRDGTGPLTCGNYGPPLGQVVVINSTFAEPSGCSSNYYTHALFTAWKNIGLIVADVGSAFYPALTWDPRWPSDSVLSGCFTAIPVGQLVAVRQTDVVNNSNYAETQVGTSQAVTSSTPAGTQFGPGNQRGPGNQVTKMGWPAEFWRDVRSTAWK